MSKQSKPVRSHVARKSSRRRASHPDPLAEAFALVAGVKQDFFCTNESVGGTSTSDGGKPVSAEAALKWLLEDSLFEFGQRACVLQLAKVAAFAAQLDEKPTAA